MKKILLGVLVTVGLSSCAQEESIIESVPEAGKNYVETFVDTDMVAAGYKPIKVASPDSEEATTRGSIYPVLFGCSSEETKGEDGRAIKAVDGNLGTHWHSKYTDGFRGMPAWISLGLSGGTKYVRGFQIYHRWNVYEARPTKMEIHYRNIGTGWRKLVFVESNGFIMRETEVFTIRTNVSSMAWSLSIPFGASEVKFVFTDANGKPYTYIGEIYLYE